MGSATSRALPTVTHAVAERWRKRPVIDITAPPLISGRAARPAPAARPDQLIINRNCANRLLVLFSGVREAHLSRFGRGNRAGTVPIILVLL